MILCRPSLTNIVLLAAYRLFVIGKCAAPQVRRKEKAETLYRPGACRIGPAAVAISSAQQQIGDIQARANAAIQRLTIAGFIRGKEAIYTKNPAIGQAQNRSSPTCSAQPLNAAIRRDRWSQLK